MMILEYCSFMQANDITTAVKERKAFIIRTMIAVVIVILIFFLNKYILKPIDFIKFVMD